MRKSQLLILVTILIFTMLFTACSNQEYKELSTSFDDLFTNIKTGFSGSVLIAIDGKTILKKGYGMADYEKQIPNTVQTEYKIGSMTKQFTSIAIMMLEERGLLSVDDPLTKYIPDFKQGDKITIHNLLSMRSGIPNYMIDEYKNCNRHYTVEELISKIKQ